jgi:cell division protein FtsZ
MVFITAGMGGGTGTGASAEIARIAQELGILTVGVVTKPFLFEGNKRMQLAEQGLIELQKYVDTLIIIPNQNLFRVANENTTFQDAFEMADAVLHSGVRSVTDLITCPGVVNLDFADIETIMNEKGKAMMGTGEDSGENRAIKAAESAISNPLLDQNSMCGAKGVLINITGGKDMTLYEVDSAANRIKEEVGDSNTNIIFGSTFNVELEGTIRVSVIATGIGQYNIHQPDQDLEKAETKTESGKIKSDSIAIDSYEPPSYDEYKNKITIKESEIELKSRLRQLHNHQIDWQQSKKT